MAKTNPSTILLKGDPRIDEAPLEALAACADGFITPGMLIERYGTDVRPHATDGGAVVPVLVALEGLAKDADSFTMGDIDTDYDEDAQAVRFAAAKSGDQYYMLLAPLTTAVINAILDSNGDGYLGVGTTYPIGRALEAKTNATGQPVRIRVEVF